MIEVYLETMEQLMTIDIDIDIDTGAEISTVTYNWSGNPPVFNGVHP